MESPAAAQLSSVKDFDRIVEVRAEKHEHLRGRNNVTSCRSPTREFDTKRIKNDLRDKRQLEFLRRRSVSPELSALKCTRTKGSPKTTKHHSSSSKYQVNENIPTVSNGHKKVNLATNGSITDDPSTSTWASLWSEQVTLMKHDKGHSRTQASTSTPVRKESNQLRTRRESSTKAQQTSVIQAENIHQKLSHQTTNAVQRQSLREAGVQTVSGFVTVKESDIQRLAEYLQEALWREEAVKKKLAALQESTSNLTNSSKNIWTARCSEDLLRNKIKALEAQLQLCLQKFPKDGLKKRVLQMEKQKLIYEEKALVALQRLGQEKSEALCMAETLKESLLTAKSEALKWKSLYEELRLSSGQLRETQHLSNELLQQLNSQVELSRVSEAELREEVVSLRQENTDLQNNICLLEEDSHNLREEIQNLRDGGNESQETVMEDCLTSEEVAPQLTPRRDSQMEEQLRHAQEKLRLKTTECEELQTELQAMEQECHSSQARLSQCREELRQLTIRRRRLTLRGHWWKVCVFLLLLFAVLGVAMLWLWHPPFREQIEDLYADIETRIENYLLGMASPQHSGCFRPI